MGLQQRESIVVFLAPHSNAKGQSPSIEPRPVLSRWHMTVCLQICDLMVMTMLLIWAMASLPFGAYAIPFPAAALILGAVLCVACYAAGTYRYRLIGRPIQSSIMALLACLMVLGPVILLNAERFTAANRFLLIWAATLVIVVTTIRLLAARISRELSRAGLLAHTVCVIGGGPEAQACVEQLQRGSSDHLLLGYFQPGGRWPGLVTGAPYLGPVEQLAAYLRDHRVDEIVVATPIADRAHLADLIADLDCLPVALSVWPGTVNLPVLAAARNGTPPDTVSLISLRPAPLSGWAWVFKEVQDRTIAALLLLAALPVLLLISVAIRLCSPGPVFYRQVREGYCGREFSIFKFRTMHVAKSDPRTKLVLTAKNDKRIFPLGALLRRCSLDELPQLLNVLNGDMWLIGPRPHSPLATAGDVLYADAVARYSARHKVKPGITGWAQISGWRGPTNTVEQIQQRVDHDLYYIDHWSPLFDLRILLLTAVRGFIHHNAF